MAKEFLLTPDSVVFREVMGELVVIHLDTGQILYFSRGTQELLNFFKQPKRLDSYLTAAKIEHLPAEAAHLKSLTQFMIENQLLEETSVGNSDVSAPLASYSRPEFLRLDEKTLDQVAFLCP